MKQSDLLKWDASWSERVRSLSSSDGGKRLAAFLAHSGDSWFWIFGLGLIWWFGDDYWRNLAILYLASIIGMAVMVLIVKLIFRRRRPEGEWGAIYRRSDPHSFPSGHAARAALLATLSLSLGPTWLGILLVIWTPLISLARVSLGVHYLSDVAVGILIGVLTGISISLFVV